MPAVTKQRVLEVVEQLRSELQRMPGVREVFAVTGGNYNAVASWVGSCRPIDDDIENVPAIPPEAVAIAATLLRWDALQARFRALALERLPALEGSHAELLGEYNALKQRYQALVADVAQLDAKKSRLLLELNALTAEMRNVLMGVRPESAWERNYDNAPRT